MIMMGMMDAYCGILGPPFLRDNGRHFYAVQPSAFWILKLNIHFRWNDVKIVSLLLSFDFYMVLK